MTKAELTERQNRFIANMTADAKAHDLPPSASPGELAAVAQRKIEILQDGLAELFELKNAIVAISERADPMAYEGKA